MKARFVAGSRFPLGFHACTLWSSSVTTFPYDILSIRRYSHLHKIHAIEGVRLLTRMGIIHRPYGRHYRGDIRRFL